MHGVNRTRGRIRSQRRQAGMALLTCCFLLFCVSLIAVTTLTLGHTQHAMSERGGQKIQSAALAEAGVHALYDAIRTQNAAGGTAPTSLATTTLTSTVNGRTVADGTYSARVVGTPTSSSPVTLGSLLRTTYTYTIEGTGTAPNGTVSRVRSTFEGTSTISVSAGASASAFLPNGAIQANNQVQFNFDFTGFRTNDTQNTRMASVLGNGGVVWNPPGGKLNQWNPNVLTFAGQIMVPSMQLALTQGVLGMGNANGRQNWQSQASTDNTALANQITSIGTARAFPDETQVNTWKSSWLSQAQAGAWWPANRAPGNISWANTPQNDWRIRAPAYINGDLNADQQQIYLEPQAGQPNIIYVRGNLNITNGLLYNRGVVIVVEGDVTLGNRSQRGQNAQGGYEIQTQNGTQMLDLMQKAAIVGLSASPSAIYWRTNRAGNTGLLYAARGGIDAGLNGDFGGALIAGGAGTLGNITFDSVNASSFNINYDPRIMNRTDFQVTATASVGSTFTANRLRGWSQTQ